MGRKGAGRKAFVKSAMAHHENDTPGSDPPAPEIDVAAPAAEDKNFANNKLAEKQSAAAEFRIESAAAVQREAEPEDGIVAAPAGSLNETRGQMVQRHKKEMKAHKEHTKKLGKKKKDEVEELDKAIDTRHAAELDAWDAANAAASGERDVTLVAPTAGLYDLKLGNDDKQQAKKPTKAQKRREQRAAEEAEREARIADEHANMGDSERELEAAALDNLLRPLGLSVREIPADGHCMYRAVHDQLETCGSDSAPGYTELREETASYMRAFPDDFTPFVVKDDDSAEDPAAQFEEYCREIEETAAWGGQIELQALAQALERHILVYSVGLPVVELGSEYKGKQAPLQVCYLRHAFGLGEHYNSVKLLKA